jgi:hypothetical protein
VGAIGGALLTGVPAAAIGGLVGGKKGAKIGGLIGTALVGIPVAISMWKSTSKEQIDKQNESGKKIAEFNKDPRKATKIAMDEQLRNLKLHKDIIPVELIKAQEITNNYISKNSTNPGTLKKILNIMPTIPSFKIIEGELRGGHGATILYTNGDYEEEIYWYKGTNTYDLIQNYYNVKNKTRGDFESLKDALMCYYKENKRIMSGTSLNWFEEVISKL